MTTTTRAAGAVALLLAGIAAGVFGDQWWHDRAAKTEVGSPHGADPTPPAEEAPEPSAAVKTVAATMGELPRTVDALGTAAIPPTATHVEAWPSDVLVVRLLVQPGEAVAENTPLIQVLPTRDSETQLATAQLGLDNASKALDSVKQRLERSLATKTDLVTAQSLLDEFKQKVERLQTGQPPADGFLRSHTTGTVTTVRIQPGATVLSGTPLVDITSRVVVAQIALDPADAASISIGQKFELQSVDDRVNGRWKGVVSLMARVVNPVTRLVDATLTFEGSAQPEPGTPLKARALLKGRFGVLVPRAALVPEGDEFVIYVVKNGVCTQTPVRISLAGRAQVVLSAGCATGDHVVVTGQDQLSPGSPVRETFAGNDTALHGGDDRADR